MVGTQIYILLFFDVTFLLSNFKLNTNKFSPRVSRYYIVPFTHLAPVTKIIDKAENSWAYGPVFALCDIYTRLRISRV